MGKERTQNTRSSLPPLDAARKAAEKRKKLNNIAPKHTKANRQEESSRSKRKGANSKRKRFRFLLWMFVCLMVMGGAVTGLGIGMLNRYVNRLDPITFLEDYKPNLPSRMYSDAPEKQLVAEFFSDDLNQNREKATLEEMPDHLKNAVVAIEDVRFYEHCGISPRAFIRAAIHDIQTWSLEQGGSTITMQLVEDLIKNDHLTIDLPEMTLKSFRQKIWEILIALKIEKQYTKEEILEIYLNQVYLGGNIYGVARAADAYFGKDVKDLTLKECALFAGMLQRPNAYSPLKNIEAAHTRTETVLYVMYREGLITEEERRQAEQEPFGLDSKSQRRAQINLYPYYAEMVRKKFEEEKAFKADDGYPIEIYGRGVDIYTTLDTELQEIAEKALRTGIVTHEQMHRRSGGKFWGKPGHYYPNRDFRTRQTKTLKADEEYDALIIAPYDAATGTVKVKLPRVPNGEGPFTVSINPGETWMDEFNVLQPDHFIRVVSVEEENGLRFVHAKNDDHVQGAIIVVQPSTGKVLALVGGYNFYDSQLIRATQYSQQPGSAFKPFLYAAAMAREPNPFTPASLIHDIEYQYSSTYKPENYENEYFGWVTLRQALTHSYNAASVWLLDNLKPSRTASIRYFHSFCKRHFDLEFTRHDMNLTVALGSAGFPPWDIAQGYSVFANDGTFVELHAVQNVYQRQIAEHDVPKLLYQHNERFIQERGITPELAYLTTNLLRSVVENGTGQPAKDLPFYHVGKTGTTDNSVRGWYVGYSDDILCVVYLGYDDHRQSLGVKMTGSKTALPVWQEFMGNAFEVRPGLFGEIYPPDGIEFAKVHTDTGLLAERDGPGVELFPFQKGTLPKAASPGRAHSIHKTDLHAYISSN